LVSILVGYVTVAGEAFALGNVALPLGLVEQILQISQRRRIGFYVISLKGGNKHKHKRGRTHCNVVQYAS
jgi:hypothetical protein